ncbi:MAG: hypothetical protein AAF703_22190 [Cyanobacteria bacterium P01_D01_bin.105]
MKRRYRKGNIQIPGEKGQRNPIEDNIQLEDYVRFSSIKGDVGAAVLSDGVNFQFKFGFKIEGIHPTTSDQQFATIVNFIESGLKAIPHGETMTIIQSVVPDNSARLGHYRTLAAAAPTPLFREMIKSAASPGEYFASMTPEERVSLARSKYKRKFLRIYVTATSNQTSHINDKSEIYLRKGAGFLEKLWGNLTGQPSHSSKEKLRELFVNGQAVYEDWVNILSQMRLKPQPMSVDELIAEQWAEFNDTPLRQVPQLMEWTGERLLYQMNDDIHLSSWLFDTQQTVPKAARDYVYQIKPNGTQRITGVVTLRNKPSGWDNPTEALKYLHNKTQGLEDYKIVLTLTRASAVLTEKNVELLQRQAQDAVRLAAKRGLPSTRSQMLQSEAEKASSDLYSGNIPFRMSLCFLISKSSQRELDIACRRLQSRFPLPASLEVEQDYTALTWLQCFPQLSFRRPLFSPYDRTRAYKASSIPAFMPIVSALSPDEKGLEFITEDEGTPYYLDIKDIHRHILFLATTRAGKSVLFASILMLAMCSDIPMVVVDYPKEDGDSTFGPITQLAGDNGAYLNIAEESNNFFELPDLSQFEPGERDRRLIEVKDYVLDLLMIIMFGPNASDGDREKRTAKSILGNILNLFYSDPNIDRRFQSAIGAPIGSPEWEAVPTLKDFAQLCTAQMLEQLLETVSPEHITLINEIRLRFESFMQTTVGRSLSQPTSIPNQANLLVFAFKGISNNDDAAILMASAAAAAMRRTLSAPVSILFMDEASILSKFDSLMEQVAKIAANGAKSGIRLMMALQTPASIDKSRFGAEILGNMSTRIIGRIDEADAKNYCRILEIPEEVIAVNASKSFFPVTAELFSRWLVVDRGERTFVRSYAPPLLLAAVANNPAEEIAKQAFLAAYPEPVEALKAFAKELILAAQQGRDPALPPSFNPALERTEKHYALAQT